MLSLSLSLQLKGTKTRRAASPESEPKFYAMPPMPQTSPDRKSPMDGSVLRDESLDPSRLTLQKIVPSLISPIEYGGTYQSSPELFQLGGPHHGLTLTSTRSLSLKPALYEAFTGDPTRPRTRVQSEGPQALTITSTPFLSLKSARSDTTMRYTPTGAPAAYENDQAEMEKNRTDTFWAALANATPLPVSNRSENEYYASLLRR